MRIPFILLLVTATFISFSKHAYSVEQPFMESALGRLKQVVNSEKPSKPTEKLILLNSAKEDLLNVPSIYKAGQKAKARKLIELAIEQLKAGDESKAIETTQKAMTQISDGIAYIANRDKPSSETESGKSKTKSSPGYFGTSK